MMSAALILSAFSMGSLSSMHCVGMCGPLALSLPVAGSAGRQRVAAALAYNFGRIATYTILGGLFGWVGRQLSLVGFQQWFSIVAGSFILMMVVQGWQEKPLFHLPGFGWVNKRVQRLVAKLLSQTSLQGKMLMGMANGLLPCGLVYVSLTGAMATGGVLSSLVFMACFGLGTVPALFVLMQFGYRLNITTRNSMKKAVPYFIAAVGLVLIVRGLGLNIPYLSPLIGYSTAGVLSCH